MPAGERKIPEPIVMPITRATELQRPSVRGRRSGDVAPVTIARNGTTDMAHGYMANG
jgi:hypothetical protein